ncbi:MAG: DUF3795 domain-containing protein [Methanotrichaceae archaeon]
MQKQDEDIESIAYCGLYCGNCFIHAGKVADLARDLRKELREVRFDKSVEALSKTPFFDVFKGYPACYEVLGALVKLRCKLTCRNGGGPPNCEIRNCCRKKGIDGCWQCAEFQRCQKLEFLSVGHGDAHLKNLRTLNRKGVSAFLSGGPLWYSKPKEQIARQKKPDEDQ